MRRARGATVFAPAFASALLAALLAAPANAAQASPDKTIKADDVLNQRWYYAEVLVFHRPAVLDYLSGEELVTRHPSAFPAALRGLDPAGDFRAAGFVEDPAAHACFGDPHPARRPPTFDREIADEPVAAERHADEPGGRSAPPIEPRLAPDPKLDALAALAAFEADLAERSYRWLGSDALQLAGAARRLESSGSHEVLLHGRWLQPVPGRDVPEPLLLQAGPRFDDRRQLEGVVELTGARYLHVRAHLLFQEPLLGRTPVSGPLLPVAAPAQPAPLLDLTAKGYIELDQSRRIRDGELHYLDHPKLGMLVRIEPVTLPADLVAKLRALEERPQ